MTDSLLTDRQRVLEAIPDCDAHGPCVPHAIEWIEAQKVNAEALSSLRAQIATLEQYADHKPGCEALRYWDAHCSGPRPGCTCGLHTLLAQLHTGQTP